MSDDELKNKARRFFSANNDFVRPIGFLDVDAAWFHFKPVETPAFIAGGTLVVDRSLIKARGNGVVKYSITMKEKSTLNALGAKIHQLIRRNSLETNDTLNKSFYSDMGETISEQWFNSKKLIINVIDINISNPNFEVKCNKCDFECLFEAILSISYNGEYIRP
jgi:hypothetical protein